MMSQALTPSIGGESREVVDVLDRTAPLQERISVALHANLARGYLESEEQFRQIVEGLHDAVWLTNANGTRVIFVNAAYEKIWGESRATLYADPLAFLARIHDDDRERVRATLMAHPDANHDVEYRVVRSPDDVRWVWSRGYPVFDTRGRLLRIGTIVEDITERRQIAESHARLVRGFTHDIKNPLGAADGHLALCEMGLHGELTGEQGESVRRARASLRTALDLIARLLDIERAESGRFAIKRGPADIEEIMHDTADEFRDAARAKEIDVELLSSRSGDSLVVETDAALVRQILANLISNAVKYTQARGHITLRTHVATDRQAPWPGRWIAVEVADNGPGIPVQKQGMVFREFARFDPDAAAGSGIGLAISQRLAVALGGAITFTSAVGVGSHFTLWIPVEPPIALSKDHV